MAFKKKKDQKKKKKSKGAKKDDWSHEGGVTIVDPYANSADDETRKKRIHTQEKDERLRRSRRKHEDKRIKSHFTKKMSQKVKFSDILASATKEAAEAAKIETVEKPVRKPNAPHSNPLTSAERLQMLISRKRPRSDANESEHEESEDEDMDSDDEHSEDQQEDEDDDDDDEMYGSGEEEQEDQEEAESNEDVSASEMGLVFGSDVKSQKVKDHDVVHDEHQIDDDESEDDALGHNHSKKGGVSSAASMIPYDWFFKAPAVSSQPLASKISLNPLDKKNKTNKGDKEKEKEKAQNSKKKVKPQLIKNITINDDVECGLYTAFTSELSAIASIDEKQQVSTVQDLPGIYKLWKSQSNPLVLNDFSKQLLPYLSTYSDAFLEGRDHINDKVMLECMLMHSLFHVVKARAKVVRHNDKLKKRAKDQKLKSATAALVGEGEDDVAVDSHKGKSKKGKSKQVVDPVPVTVEKTNNGAEEEENDDVMRDQGFTRPRLLILCPFRATAKEIVKTLIRILGENTSISGLEKFETEFADPEDSDDEENDKEKKTKRPADWEALFNGNMDDDFKLGIQVNPGHGKGSGSAKGVYLRLFSDFYISDIIVASPIGLKLAMEANANKLNIDFLTSIEQVMIHQADVISMQNWEHVDFILRHANRLPKEHHEDTDYSRVRSYFLDGKGSEHRQLMMSTHFNTPELQAFFREFGLSRSGSIRLKRSWNDGFISNVFVPVKQTFQLIPSISSLQMEEDMRFEYFKDNVLSQILRLRQNRTLIFAPSYLQYVRIRNELIRQEASAVFVCEYSRESEISRGRAWFYQGVKNIMVYSGRAHFFRRFKIRGAKHLIFYSSPEYPHFYPEMVNMLGEVVQNSSSNGDLAAEDMSCLTLFTPCDKMALDRIIGPKRADHMLSSNKSTFLFF